MQDAKDRSSDLTRRGAVAVAGAAITGAAIHTTGGALAQTTERSAAPQGETRNASVAENSIKLTHKRANRGWHSKDERRELVHA